MNPIEWYNLSDEEKAALIEMCKEDPVVFIETVCGVELLECQKVLVRETFKALKRPDKSKLRTKYLCEPGERTVIDISKEVTYCTCKYGDGWRKGEPCRSRKSFSN